MARSTSLARGGDLAGDKTERDSATVESLVNRYRPLVTHIVYRTLGGRADAEDVCQEVLLRICQGLQDFRFESKMSTWIARIAYNTCINHLQKKRETLIGDLPGNDRVVEDFRAERALQDEQTVRADLAERLEAEIRTMPEQLRTILTLYHLDDMSYLEIGEVMNLPEGTVKSYLFRARRQLRQKLMRKYNREDFRS